MVKDVGGRTVNTRATGDLEFKSQAGQNVNSVTNGSPPLQGLQHLRK